MKKSIIIFAAMFTMMATLTAQNSNPLRLDRNWAKMAGYSYQAAYPYGFSLAGGSFLSFGFADSDKRFDISTNAVGLVTEYREPTWSIRCGWIGYNIDEDVTGWGAVSFRPYVALGMDMAKSYTLNNLGSYDSKTKVYFTFAPSVVVNLWMLHFSVGYEIVPAFKELNGLNFGAGFSIAISSDKLDSTNPINKSKSKNKKKK